MNEMIGIMLVVFSILLVLYFFHRYVVKPYGYWIDKGVPQVNPVYLFGDLYRRFLGLECFAGMIQRLYNSSDTRYVGVYQMTQPILLIRDPDLLKQVMVKDFEYFVNHFFALGDTDPLTRFLLAIKDQDWRDQRNILSPAFTGNKMKYIFTLIRDCAEEFVNHFSKIDDHIITLELNDAYTRLTNDVIATAAFGVKCDSLKNRNNEFYENSTVLVNFTGFGVFIKFMGFTLVPRLMEALKIRLFDRKAGDFLRSLITDTIDYREKHNIQRPDMLQLLMQARRNMLENDDESSTSDDINLKSKTESIKNKEENKINMSLDDITSHAIFFIAGGRETTANLMSFTSYELAINPDIQQKLIAEIDDVRDNINGKVSYEEIMKMKYLDMVISESLRKWPVVVQNDRAVKKPYTIKAALPGEKDLHLKVGDIIWSPVYALHHDPKYFPNPEKFDPERFNSESKTNLNKDAYMPFGIGPRACLGLRFALLEVKVAFFYLLSKFEIVPVKESIIPLVLSKKTLGFNATAEGGFWFGLKRRSF